MQALSLTRIIAILKVVIPWLTALPGLVKENAARFESLLSRVEAIPAFNALMPAKVALFLDHIQAALHTVANYDLPSLDEIDGFKQLFDLLSHLSDSGAIDPAAGDPPV